MNQNRNLLTNEVTQRAETDSSERTSEKIEAPVLLYLLTGPATPVLATWMSLSSSQETVLSPDLKHRAMGVATTTIMSESRSCCTHGSVAPWHSHRWLGRK